MKMFGIRKFFSRKPKALKHDLMMKPLYQAPKTRGKKMKDRIEGLSTGKKIGGGVGLGVVLGLGGGAVTGLASRNKSKLGPTKQHGAANVGAQFYTTAPRSRKV